jgi:hypothetical protein
MAFTRASLLLLLAAASCCALAHAEQDVSRKLLGGTGRELLQTVTVCCTL